jgi:hypothetical protein
MPTFVSAHASRGLACVALGLFAVGCGTKSTTEPHTTPSPFVGSYRGIIDGGTTSGTVTITVAQASSADRVSAPVRFSVTGSNTVTVTLTTASGQSITLTGSLSDSTVTVTSASPPATCTIVFTSTGVSGNCTAFGQTLSLAAFIQASGIQTTLYCGTQSAGAAAGTAPTATLGALVSGSNVYLVVAPPTGAPTLYSGTLSSGNVTLTTSASGEQYGGTEAAGGATISGTITSGGTGSWSVANPCTPGADSLSASTVHVSAAVGSTTAITPSAITISNGGSGTLGVLSVGAAIYTPSANTGWLQATLSSPTTTSGTLSLSISPTGLAAGTYTATVPVSASLGAASPKTLTVTLTITAAPPPALMVTPNTLTFNSTPGGTPASQTVAVTSSGGTASGLSTQTAYGQGASPWLSAGITPSATPATITFGVSGTGAFPPGTYTATVTVASTTTGVGPVQVTVNLVIQASVSTGWIKVMWGAGSFGNTMCGIQASGAAYCWGNDAREGTLGDNSTVNSVNPQPVSGGLKFSSLASGATYGYVCGVTTNGTPYCWGNGTNGELGNGSPNGVIDSTPQLVSGGLTFDSITAALLENACGLTPAGAAWCWGANGAGELGNDTTGNNTGLVPQLVVGNHTFVQIVSGNATTCAVDNAGAAWCWGIVGNPNPSPVIDSVPVLQPAPGSGLTWQQLALATASEICGLASNGAAYCWGANGSGNGVGLLGAGVTGSYYPTPQLVLGGHTFSSIVTGPCALEAVTGKLFCWGAVASSPFGIVIATAPTQYASGLTFSQISEFGNCGVTNGNTNNSEIYCTLLTSPTVVPALGGPAGTVGARVKPPTRARR